MLPRELHGIDDVGCSRAADEQRGPPLMHCVVDGPFGRSAGSPGFRTSPRIDAASWSSADSSTLVFPPSTVAIETATAPPTTRHRIRGPGIIVARKLDALERRAGKPGGRGRTGRTVLGAERDFPRELDASGYRRTNLLHCAPMTTAARCLAFALALSVDAFVVCTGQTRRPRSTIC